MTSNDNSINNEFNNTIDVVISADNNKFEHISTKKSKINTSTCIYAESIDDIDKLNMTDSLEGITFCQGDRQLKKSSYEKRKDTTEDENSSLKELTSLLDSESDDDDNNNNNNFNATNNDNINDINNNENNNVNTIKQDAKGYINKIFEDTATIGSIIVSTGELFDREKVANYGFDIIDETKNASSDSNVKNSVGKEIDTMDNSNMLYYSNFFELNENKRSFVIDVKDLIRELFIIIFFHLFLGIHNAIFNILTIDGILSCIIFYMNFLEVKDNDNFLLRNRLITLDRYIYYLLLFCGYYLFNYMTWFKFTGTVMYVASIMICPSIMGQIYNQYAYKKIRRVLYDGYNKLIQKIICKQLSKIINLVIKNLFNLDITVNYEDLLPFYNQFSWLIINKFIVTFIMACIFNHIDKGGMKFPMMIYKNLYLKDGKYNIADDKKYLHAIILDKQWEKFMDIYTLNRIIRIVINDDVQNTMLSEQVSAFLQKILFRFNRVMFCWTIMSVSNLMVGVLSFFLFISHTERPLRYLINTLVFTLLSLFTTERLLILILCELCYPIIDSKLLSDITEDTYQSLKRGFLSVYYKTRLESVLLSMLLLYTSYYNHSVLGIMTVCIMNIIIMLRIAYRMTINVSTNNNSIESSDYSINNKPKIQIESSVNKIITYPVKILKTSGIISDNNVNVFNNSGIDLTASSDEILVDSYDNLNTYNTLKSKRLLKRSRSGLISNISRSELRNNKLNQINNPSTKTLNNIIGVDILSAEQIDLANLHTPFKIITAETENTDILLILKDRIKKTFKNNLLIRVVNPFVEVHSKDILRIFAHVFILLILSYISSFNVYHVTLLPIVVQNVIDILF